MLCCGLSRRLGKSSLGSTGLSQRGGLIRPTGRCCSIVSVEPRRTWDVQRWTTWKHNVRGRLCWWKSYCITHSFNHGPWWDFQSLHDIYCQCDKPWGRRMLIKAPTRFAQAHTHRGKPRSNHPAYLFASQNRWPRPPLSQAASILKCCF